MLVFAPKIDSPAVEVWIEGNDIPYIKVGQKAKVQFEGWPSVQVAGWPSVAIGTFNARVKLVDQASSYLGKFRVLLTAENNNWPTDSFLRLNSNARAIIHLRETILGVDLWRQLNSFPIVEEPIRDELSLMLKTKQAAKGPGK